MIELDVTRQLGSFRLTAAFTAGSGITALFGPSGSGKSSLIKLIAGLDRPDQGHIRIDGQTVTDPSAGVHLPAHRRRIGIVFQESRLFPHLSVRRNLAFGRWFCPPSQRRIAPEPVIDTLGIAHLLDRAPATLSGGEKQRVAIGRALIASPRLLLMDEPLAALDWERRQEILPLIERLRDEFAIPIVYVSHSMEEVARLAGNVVVLEHGRVLRSGSPSEVLRLAEGGGDRFRIASVIEGRLGEPDRAYAMTPVIHAAGTIWLSGIVGPAGRPVRVLIRGTDVALARTPPEGITIQTALAATIAAISRLDDATDAIDLRLPGGNGLTAIATRRAVDGLGFAPGSAAFALIKSVALDERPL